MAIDNEYSASSDPIQLQTTTGPFQTNKSM